MFLKDVLALPEWFLFVELFVYAGIIFVGIIPTAVRVIKVRKSRRLFLQEFYKAENELDSRVQQKVEEIKKNVDRQYLDSNEKRKQTVKEKYGVDYAFQYTSNEKRRQTMLNKYGVEYAFQLKNESQG